MTRHEDVPYIEHILDAINAIQKSVKNLSKEKFLEDDDVRDANIRRLEIIGEATKNLSNEFKDNHRGIEWSKISGTRDKMIHKYFDVDMDITWNIIKKDLPKLKKQIEKIIKELKPKRY